VFLLDWVLLDMVCLGLVCPDLIFLGGVYLDQVLPGTVYLDLVLISSDWVKPPACGSALHVAAPFPLVGSFLRLGAMDGGWSWVSKILQYTSGMKN